jgi:hypothetical protein
VTAQTITADDTVSLSADPTYLDKMISTPSVPVAVTLPKGTQKGQYKRILIAGDKIAGTERFNLIGTFAGFSSLYFDSVGFNAVLFWDGTAWQVSGNVNVIP